MARPYRLQSEDCFYHITSRGNDRKKIFLNDTDFEKFLEYIVRAKGKSGHLFQGRYKSLVVEADSYFQELTRYIHLNPIRAKVVENPGDYKWSSYKAYIGRKRKDTYIDKQEIRNYIDITGESYRLFVLDGMSGGEEEEGEG